MLVPFESCWKNVLRRIVSFDHHATSAAKKKEHARTDAHELDLQGDVRGLPLRRELFQSWASYCVQHRNVEIPPMGNNAMRHFVSLVPLSSCVVVAVQLYMDTPQ